MVHKIKLGIVGAGMVSQLAHLTPYVNLTNVEIVAIADHDYLLAKMISVKFSIKEVYASHKELLEKADVEAIVVVVNRHKAHIIVRDALMAGKHVLMEKPMALNSLLAKELCTLASDRKRILAVGFMKRHDEGVRKAKEVISSAKELGLGEMISVRCRNYCSSYIGYCEDYIKHIQKKYKNNNQASLPIWLPTCWAEQYDWFTNVASHTINLIQYFFGNNLNIHYSDFSNPSMALAIFKSEDIPILMDVGKASTGRWEEAIEFYFEFGRLEIMFSSLKQRDCSATLILDRNEDGHVRTIETPEGPWAFAMQAKNFIDTIKGGSQLLTSPLCGARGIELGEAIWKNYLKIL